jgi:hypothetical protein
VGNLTQQAEGPFGGAIQFRPPGWLEIPRHRIRSLDIGGVDAEVTVAAWLNRHHQSGSHCEAIAGLWDETRDRRQYCLFLNLPIWDSADQVGGHVSETGGPTPPFAWCTEAAIGATPVSHGEWHTAAFTYDGEHVRAYIDGRFDERPQRNPYVHRPGLLDAGPGGSAFTVGAVHRKGEMGNWFAGLLGGVAVFSRALRADEIRGLHQIAGQQSNHPEDAEA